jgi:hypothetical protein
MQKIIFDCSTGEETLVDLTPDEIAQQTAHADELGRQDTQASIAAAQRIADLKVIQNAAKTDPVIAALVRVLEL